MGVQSDAGGAILKESGIIGTKSANLAPSVSIPEKKVLALEDLGL